jgi:Carboxypeptidase regulatory-like domain/TonB dependent receptor-like, beta-barrel
MKRFLLYVVLASLSCSGAMAQVATGSMSGTVSDPNGAAIPGARVVATNVSNGIKTETVTSEAGLYVFASLSVGMYDVSVEMTGFKKLNRTGIEIRIASRQELDIKLELGNLQETVEVTGEVPLLETTSSQRGQNFSPEFMSNLPLFSGGIRNPRTFVNYMPGASPGAELSVSGSGGRAQEILIDGASATIPESGGVSFNFPAAEMFGEFKLLTSTFDAEYGRFGGGVELYVTKSGTNQFHGTAFLNMRRDIWNANAWAFNASGRVRPKDRINEMGGAVGGPAWIPKVYDGRNKTFFYFTYSKDERPETSAAVLSTVPTVRMKQGDFGELPASQIIYDPETTSGNTRQPFPNNVIPRSRFSRIATNLLAAIPDPTRPSLTGNYDNLNLTVFDKYIWNLKLDHAFTPSNRIAFTVTKERELSDVLSAFPGPLGQGLQTYQRPDNWRWNHDLVIKPNMLLHTTFGYSRTRQLWDNPFQKGAASRFGFGGITGDADAMPRVVFTGADGLSPWGVQDGKVANGSQINITYHLSQGLSWIRGAHEFKTGWDFRRLHTTSDPIDLAGTNGRYEFARAQSALPTNLAATGHAFASLLLGLPDRAERVALPVLVGNIRYGYHAAYFQDNWKINPRLALTLGMRYDIPINWHDKNGDYSGMDRQIPNPGADGLPGAIVFFGEGPGRTGEKRSYPTDFSNFGPRLGFSYRLFDKTIIRGGYGIFYQTLGNGGCGCRLGFANPITTVSDGVNGALNWDDGINPPPGFRPPPLIDPTVGNFNNVDVFSDNFGRAPRIHSWSVNLQHEISNFLVDIAYVANRGRSLNSTVLLNQLPVSRLSLGSLLQRRIDDPTVVAAGFTKPYSSFPNNQTLAQALRPYPQFLDVSERNAGVGRTWYDSLQAKVERRFSAWQMMAAYTWSKSLGVAHYRQIFSQNFPTAGYSVAAQDNYNYDEMKSFLPFDLPHVFNFLNSYELPFGRGKKFINTEKVLVNLLVGNWIISGLQQYRSGALILVQAPANTLGTGVLFTQFKKANVGTGPIRTGIDRTTLDPNNPATRWLNADAFTSPGQFDLGHASQYYTDFRQPPLFIDNLSIQKRMKFPISADRTIDLVYRADAFNLFNRTNFGGVVGTIGNPNFGRPTGPQLGSRLITMGFRLDF